MPHCLLERLREPHAVICTGETKAQRDVLSVTSQEFFNRVGNRIQVFWLQLSGLVQQPGGRVSSEPSPWRHEAPSTSQPQKSHSLSPLWPCPLQSQSFLPQLFVQVPEDPVSVRVTLIHPFLKSCCWKGGSSFSPPLLSAPGEGSARTEEAPLCPKPTPLV